VSSRIPENAALWILRPEKDCFAMVVDVVVVQKEVDRRHTTDLRHSSISFAYKWLHLKTSRCAS